MFTVFTFVNTFTLTYCCINFYIYTVYSFVVLIRMKLVLESLFLICPDLFLRNSYLLATCSLFKPLPPKQVVPLSQMKLTGFASKTTDHADFHYFSSHGSPSNTMITTFKNKNIHNNRPYSEPLNHARGSEFYTYGSSMSSKRKTLVPNDNIRNNNYPRNENWRGSGRNNQQLNDMKSQKLSPKYLQSPSGRKGSATSNRRSVTRNFDPSIAVDLENDAIKHVFSPPLLDDMKVGYAIQNLTGQSLRYLQQWEGGIRTIQYLEHNQRGLLNFLASTTVVRNNEIVQCDADAARVKKRVAGKRLALQIAGYKWLPGVSADELGVKFESLKVMMGRKDVIKEAEWNDMNRVVMSNALKVISEVVPSMGGRMLRLRSVFTVKNCTHHTIKLLGQETNQRGGGGGGTGWGDSFRGIPYSGPPRGRSRSRSNSRHHYEEGYEECPYYLKPGEEFQIPLALLFQSVGSTKGKSLGCLFICPADMSAVESELQEVLRDQQVRDIV